jgi:uncharacterized membrane protein YkvA (DUF1232 family)
MCDSLVLTHASAAPGASLLLAVHFTLPAIGSVAGALLYVLSPLDLIPDVSVIGLVDDIVVFLLLLVFISTLYRNAETGAETPATDWRAR